MIQKSTMNYQANEALALSEVLHVAYETAFNALSENQDSGAALERVKNILFLASNTCEGMAHALSDLISECSDGASKEAKE